MDSDDYENFVTAFSELWEGIQVLCTQELPVNFGAPTWVSAEDKGEQACRTWAQEALLPASR